MKTIACNNCGYDSYKQLLEARDRLHQVDKTPFQVVRCERCGLVCLNPQPSVEELEKYYPRNYGPYQRMEIFKYGPISNFLSKNLKNLKLHLHREKTNHVTEATEREVEIIKYLDFGCGGGIHLENMRKRHPSWILAGFDNNKFACENAHEKGFNVFCGELEEIELPNNSFDIVNMGHVIEHLNDPKNILSILNRSIKNNGEIVITTPNIESCAARLFGSYWYNLDTPRHLFLFSEKTLTSLLQKTGYKITEVTYERGPKAEIRSLYFWLGKKDLRINPFIWRLFLPLTVFLSYFGKTSSMTICARKIES